jgi:methionyl-tRNA formyltransferase
VALAEPGYPAYRNILKALGLEVRTPASLRGEAESVAAFEPDALVVVAYGLILPQAVLDAAPLGAFNLHASLLPRWRGAAPINRAIMAGDTETGVAVMKMEAGLDTGPVAMEERVPIGPADTAGELAERLSRLGADLMARALGGLERGTLSLRPQAAENVTYAHKIDKAEAAVDWRAPAASVRNLIHGLSPAPGAHGTIPIGGAPERLKLLLAETASGEGPPGTVLDDRLTVACGSGAVRLLRVQRPGKGPVSRDEFLRGARITAGDRFAVAAD